MRSTKFWLLLIGGLLAVSAVLAALLFQGGRGNTVAVITQNGKTIRTIDLDRMDKPYSFTVEWENGYNIIEVERGRIRVSEADCPDKVCVRRGWVSDSAAPIACLPHKLVIQLEGGGEADIDGVAG